MINTQQLETTFSAETVTSSVDPRPARFSANTNSNNSSPSVRHSSSSASAPTFADDLSSERSHFRKLNLPGNAGSSGSDPGDDEYFLLSPQGTTQPVASAHLRTGLQSCSRGDAPRPKPRRSQARNELSSNRATPAPEFSAAQNRPPARRESAGAVRSSVTSEESIAKYPKFELARIDQDVVLKLNEVNSQRNLQTSQRGQ